MRFAYADPPYLGMCNVYQHNHPDGRCWDDIETHRLLIERLGEYDGWAMSLASTNLRDILPICPPDVRVMAWCKSFAIFKKGVHPAYAWEPVIIRGARTRGTGPNVITTADYTTVPIAVQRGTIGAKPEKFVWWMLSALNVQPQDEFVDLFHGSGGVKRAWEAWRMQVPMGLSA